MKNHNPLILTLVWGLALAFTWNNYIPAVSLFIAFVPLLILLENKGLTYLRIYNLSFIALIIYHIGTVWWLYKSSVFGFLVITISNSMYLSLAILLIYRVRKSFGLISAWFSFVCVWLAFEYIHYSWELSWPFMNLGNWLGQTHQWVQWYEYTGVLGGTLWILLINLFIYLIYRSIQLWDKLKIVLNSGFLIVVIVLPMLVSNYLYKSYSEDNKTLTFKIIQPNIDPYTEKYNSKLFEYQIEKQISMAFENNSVPIDCYLFPESTFPEYLNEDSCGSNSVVVKVKKELLKAHKALVLGGMYSYMIVGGDTLFCNASFGLNADGEIETRHKSKLVIGVEKMPFQDYFGFLKQWNLNFGGFNNSLTIDDEVKNFVLPDSLFSIAPIICYESVYGQYVADFVLKGATCIAVITNDAWWGNTPGFHQHLMHSKLRAIENRRNVARSANTGVSCIINGRGDIVSETTPFRQNVLTGKVYQNQKTSFYANYGDYIGKMALICTIMLLILGFCKIIFQKYGYRKD